MSTRQNVSQPRWAAVKNGRTQDPETTNSNRPRGTSERWEGARSIPRDKVKELHTLDQSPFRQFVLSSSALAIVSSLSYVAWQVGYPIVTVVLWCVAGFLAHALPLASHDASHGTLHRSKRINELLGIVIGTLILVPRSVFRYAHAQHHTHIATEKDPELWPFTVTTIPRWSRRLAAFTEVVFGSLYTPLLLLRCVVKAKDIKTDQLKLIRREYALIVFFWSTVIATVAALNLWSVVLTAAVGPWLVAGVFQSLNKYVEHMGMMGVGVVGNTRSVVPKDAIGKSLAECWHNVAYHGTHHLYAKIPFYKLPDASEHVIEVNPPEGTLFTSYFAAFLAMVKTLSDPRIGAQWKQVA